MSAGGSALANRMARIGGSTKQAELLLGHLIAAEGGQVITGGLGPYAAAIGELEAHGVEIAVASLVAEESAESGMFAALTCRASRPAEPPDVDHVALSPSVGSQNGACIMLIVAASVPFGATAWIFVSDYASEELIERMSDPSRAPTDIPFGFILNMASRYRHVHQAPTQIREPYPLDVNVPNAAWRALDRLAFTLGHPQEPSQAERPKFADRLHEGGAAFRRAATINDLAWIALGLCRRYAATSDALSFGAKKDRDLPTLGS